VLNLFSRPGHPTKDVTKPDRPGRKNGIQVDWPFWREKANESLVAMEMVEADDEKDSIYFPSPLRCQ